MLLAGLRRFHSFATAAETIRAQWRDLVPLWPLPGQVGTVAYGAICQASEEAGTMEYLAGAEVESFDALPPEMGRMRLPAQRYAVFTHEGHVSGLAEVWKHIWSEWLPTSGVRPANTPDFERYDERFDGMTASGVIEIWFPVEENEGATSGDATRSGRR